MWFPAPPPEGVDTIPAPPVTRWIIEPAVIPDTGSAIVLFLIALVIVGVTHDSNPHGQRHKLTDSAMLGGAGFELAMSCCSRRLGGAIPFFLMIEVLPEIAYRALASYSSSWPR